MDLKSKARKLKAEIPVVFIALKDEETPFLAKLFALICVGYALSPIDLIPDFIPVLGYLDDVLILPFLVFLTMKFIPDPVWERSKIKAIDLWKDGKPKNWKYGIPILLLWLIFILWLVKVFLE